MNSAACAARLVSLGKAVVRAVKHTLHKSRRSKPFSTVSEGCDRATAVALLAGALATGGIVNTETTRFLRVTLDGEEAAAWLSIQLPIGPVKESFPVWCARGEPRPKIRVDVGIETVEILHDSSKALLTLKIRTLVVERGPLRQEIEAIGAAAQQALTTQAQMHAHPQYAQFAAALFPAGGAPSADASAPFGLIPANYFTSFTEPA